MPLILPRKSDTVTVVCSRKGVSPTYGPAPFLRLSGGKKMEQNQSYLAEERLGRLMGKYAVPCIISLLVGALYNIVEQIFIANAD